MRRAFERTLLCGVSLLALSVAGGLGHARSLTPGATTMVPTAAAQEAAIQAAQQAAGAATQAQASLARAAAALAAMRKLQSDAAAAAQAATSSVPNGLVKDGLMPAGGTASDPLAGIKADASKWRGANSPVQTTNGSKVSVDIQQTQQKSILYWDTFNVGANTTVNFRQSASDWIALNRVQDPSAAPSRILGQINAPGAVYLINRNGIVFGAGSQVNVHRLIASSLDIGPLGTKVEDRDTYFLNLGVANLSSFSIYDKDGGATTKLIAGDVKVERGASITGNIQSDQVALGSPGSVYLFGANVYNSGAITVPSGEVAMVAARTIDVVPNGYSKLPDNVLGKDDSGKTIKFRGTEFRISQFASSYSTRTDDATDPFGYPFSPAYLAGTGAISHDGLIDASRGIVIMNGDTVTIDNPRDASGRYLTESAGNLIQGVISVDTSVDRNSMVLLRAATSVTINGVISSLPIDDGAPGLTSAQSFTPAYVEMTAQTNVAVGPNGLISAPSAQVALNAQRFLHNKSVNGTTEVAPNLFNQGMSSAGVGGNADVSSNSNGPQTVLLAPGATIDVAGLQNVELPASYNVISFKPLAEFADMPLQRPPYASVGADGRGAVYGQMLWIDIRNSGTRSDGTKWVGTPLADASGYVAKVPRSISQLMTVGGSISLSTELTTTNGAPSVKTDGSIMNVAGGSVKFLPGMVNTTHLIGSDGRIYSMANADPNMTFLGIAGQFTVKHARWGVTETWSTQTQIDSPGYTEGHDAGSVNVVTINPSLLGTIYFGATAGERQISAGQLPLQGSLSLTTPSSVQIGATQSANYTAQSTYTTNLSADTLSGYGLSSLSVTANDFVLSSDSTLNLAAGGSLSITAGGAIDIAGTVSAAGGSVNLVTDRIAVSGNFNSSAFKPPTDKSGKVIAANIFVEGTIDVSGRFINDIGRGTGDAVGSAFTNGGSISLTTNKDSASSSTTGNSYVDTTGSILLAKSSVLDVSSGGYVSSSGKAKTAATGVMAGKAGSISLAIYNGRIWDDVSGPHTPTQGIATQAVIELDGNLRGYGFESNGSLRLAAADTIRIGGKLQPGETSSIRVGGVASTLPTSLLTGGGFGSYTIESVPDDWSGAAANIIASAGTNLTLQQQNLSSLADYTTTPTGTRLGQATPQLAMLPDDQRKPVNLTLKANNILLDTGSKVVTDPKAIIAMEAVTTTRAATQPSDPNWNVPAQSVDLRGSIVDHGGSVLINALKTHLSTQAKVDLSGTFVANSLLGTTNGAATSGTYVAGGTFAVEAGQISLVPNQTYFVYSAPTGVNYLVADSGALVDVSGAAGNIQVAGARGATSSQWTWSDAGTVSANVGGFAWGGGFAAAGGRYVAGDGGVQADARANGGTILLGGGPMSLRQDITDVTNTLAAYQFGIAPRSLVVAADQLVPFDNVYLYAGSALGGAPAIFTDLPGKTYGLSVPSGAATTWSPLTISGRLNWNVTNRLHIAAGSINAPASGSIDARIAAPYVSLTGNGTKPVVGTSTLTVNAQTIDIEGAPTPSTFKSGDALPGLDFSGFSQINLIASGDIRLGTLKVADGLKKNSQDKAPTAEQSSFTGNMISAGDFLLSAQRIYPVTAVTFTIETPGNVRFAAPADGNTKIPLSAGGGITVHAKTIDQAGNLFAPLGNITLGNTDSSVSPIITQSVVLAPGSLTSVSLADMTVPYGATADGTNWYYNASLNPLAQPPSKGLVLAGSNVKRSEGSTIDLRGGGDIQAVEWVQGKGGSRDTLTTTPLGQIVYALVPSQVDPVSAFDIHFTTARSADNGKTITAGDAVPLAGQQITIDGGSGIAAGTYTLYPAHYATLPGAMRVVVYSNDNTGRNLATGTTLPDGTVLVTGNYTQSTVPGKQSSGQTVFAVQTNSVWQQYSEYSFKGANTYFTQQAVKQNATVPRLPVDAGRLSVSALQSIVLNGVALTQPGQDSSGNFGRGGELDVSAPQLAVVGHAGFVKNDVRAGYVGLDVTQLNGFESVLIGGARSDTTTGTLITPTASNVLVDTQGEAFSAPEILLVAQVAKPTQLQTIPQTLRVNGQTVVVENQVFVPAPDSGTVRIAGGSVIATTGVVHTGAGRNYYFADPTNNSPTASTAQDVATALGGTLDATGTAIIGADISKLSYVVQNADGSFVINPDGSQYRHIGSINAGDLDKLQNYSYQTKGLNALFAASNDTSLKLSIPTKLAPPSLTIQFASSVDPNVPGAMSGSLVLPDAGRVHIEHGANITSKVLTLDATGTVNSIVLNSSDFHLQQLNVTGRTIGLGSPTLVTDKSVALYNQQFADVQALSLKALSGVVTLYGDFNPGVTKLTLDAAALARADGAGSAELSVNSGTIELISTGAANVPANLPSANGGFALAINGTEIVLGGGAQSILGYGQVRMHATDRVLAAGVGTMTLGAGNDVVDLSVATPSFLVAGATAAGGGSFEITTRNKGNVAVISSLTHNSFPDRPTDSTEIGGSLKLTAKNIIVDSTIQAQAGTITLSASGSDFGVWLMPHAYLAAGGYKKTLVDVDTYLAGGKVVLNSGANVRTDAHSVIDVVQPTGGLGYGGEIDVTALNGGAALAGNLRGAGGPGHGGTFKLDINGSADLSGLADQLLAGGVSGAIDIHTRTGNLELSQGHTLKANAVTLTADDPTWATIDPSKQLGQVIISGTVDASGYAGNTADGAGQAGGQVGLFGHNAVVLTSSSQILARTTHADERGGDVMIGTAWSAVGKIDLQSGAVIDVSGGTRGGLSGGTVTLRAPLDGNNDVKIKNIDATITGARAVNIQGFLTINTEASPNNVSGIDGSRLTTKNGTKVVWDGYVDPAGLVTSKGTAPDFGTWTNVTGDPLVVTPGTYTAPPNISVVTSTGATITGAVDPANASFYLVTDPVTGTTFRSSLQVASINVTDGGSYTSAPTITVTAADGSKLPNWGIAATAKAKLAFNDINVSGLMNVPGQQPDGSSYPNISNFNGNRVNLLGTPPGGQLQVIGTGHLVVTNGVPTVVVDQSNITSTVPTQVFVRTSFFGGTLYPAGYFSATMKVTGATVTGGFGYSGAVNVAFSSDPTTGATATGTATMGAALSVAGVSKGYRSVADLPQISFAGNGGGSVSFATQTTGLTGATDQDHIFAPNGGLSFVPLASSKVFNGAGDAAALTVASYQPHQLLYSDVLANFVQGNGIQGAPDLAGKSYGFSGLLDRLQNGLVKQLGADVVHVQPGIELVNTKVSNTTNSGDITVVSNWNLAAGIAGNLQTGSRNNQSFQYFDPASSYVNFTYRLATPWGGLDAGALTLRAAGNINVNASISDGFFQFGNYLDPNYIAAVQNYIASQGGNGRKIDPNRLGLFTYYLNNYANGAVPIAPYQSAGNIVSPTAQDLAAADLFPHQLHVCTTDCSSSNLKLLTAPSSWSYGFTAGAAVSSANPSARISLASAQAGINGVAVGNITVDKHTTYTSKNSLFVDTPSSIVDVTYNLPTMVRTGTGRIDMAAAQDVVLNDTVAPGAIYAAGVNTAKLIDPNYTLNTASGAPTVAVGNTDASVQQALFLEPRVLAYGNNATIIPNGADLYYGPPTAAAFPERGGDVRIDAQRDIVGNVTSGNKVVQYYQPWLLSDSGVASASSAVFGAGVFAPSGTQIASQTAWWIQYSSFQQGILSAGGNVSVTAERDLQGVSVSLPTTGRVSGGLTLASTPVTHLYDSGNMVVTAGRDILGGSFYEGAGHGIITAGRSVGQNGTVSRYASSPIQLPDTPLLAVDTGQIAISARGSISIAGVVNPAELHVQQPSLANPLDPGSSGKGSKPIYMDTYGQDSRVRLVAETGDLTISIAPTAITDLSPTATGVTAAAAMYPASFEALALNGNLITTGMTTQDATGAQIPRPRALFPTPGIVLSSSEHGTFQLMAQGSVDLSFGYPRNTSTLFDNTQRPYISAGPSLIDSAFDPFQPNNGFAGSTSGTVLAHQDDAAQGIDTVARIYAATGDITATGSYGKRTTSDDNPGYQHIEINRPTRVYAGRDVIDLNVIVQNIHAGDVSTISAGRNINYTGFNNGGGLQVAGPGFLVVQAGGDIGPFLPAAHDNPGEVSVQEGIVSVGNSSPTAVGNIYVSSGGGSVGLYDTALLGSRNNPRRNAALTAAAGTKQGADIVTLFGTKFGVDYQAVVNTYVDPANAAGVEHNYVAALRTFLARVGKPASGSDDASAFAAFKALPTELQHIFVDQVFFAELKAVGIIQASGTSADSQRGYRMINTMFPSSLGYTANALGGGSNGANQLVKTGDMNLLHATIQTQLGGDISLFGPGGNITVGSLAAEPNSALKLRDIGILTLGGGAISTFTDQSVLVNSSRVLSTQGGDVLMWSSNGNLDAGRGSKTTLSAPALQVLYDQDDYQSIDLGGFVTGAGIGTLQASTAAAAAQLYLIAPRGTIDFGTAGVRASGNAVFVAPVVANASNFQVQGNTTGIPTISVPNVGALTAGSNTAGAAAKTADAPTAAGNSKPASIFIVEVIGYGGGEGQGDPSTDKKESDTKPSGDGKQ
ncbi:filamentous hemagglutinin family protein [Bradyrhizobium erythrophlei]|uniref:filamentous haemagglutinin family protein n=1 Tax=Bradyrhizobium erythrophlei TaxID=1437360 RepID=UPI0035E589FF